jgi:hypothetical protein
LSASITGFNSTFMIALPLKARFSRSRSAGDRLPSPGTAYQIVANNVWHVCSELLTVSVSPPGGSFFNQAVWHGEAAVSNLRQTPSQGACILPS